MGDPHASPDTNNDRFTWLGNCILEEAPDIVVCMGDFADMNSLSSYDKNKKCFEGRRYRLDIAATVNALQRINKPLEDYNISRKNTKKAQRKAPRMVMLYGNHDEARIKRAVENSPQLEGVLDVRDLRYEEFGWETHTFRQPVNIEGIWFNHYFASGIKGEAVSGDNVANLLLQKNMSSSVSGHNHLLDFAIRTKPDGSPVIGISAGCYLEQPTYDEAQINKWWKGLIWLKNVKDGIFDLETVQLERVRSLYA